MKKTCRNCGYKTEEKDLKCPICGGPLYFDTGAGEACDPAEEKEWNSGYHNDFEEGRKTGEYCDPRFEKYANGGEHYHGTQKTTFNQKTYTSQEMNLTPKAAVIIALIVSVFIPFVGPLFIIGFTKTQDGEAARAARRAAIMFLILTVISGVLTFASGLFDL